MRTVLGPFLLFGCGGLASCAATADFLRHNLEDNHLLGRTDHGWHSGPGRLVGGVVGAAVFLPLLPLFLIETLVEGEPMQGGHQFSMVFPSAVGGLVGSAFALPFFVIGYPLEFVDWRAIEETDRQAEEEAARDKDGSH